MSNGLKEKIQNLHKVNLAGIIDVLIRKGTFKKWPFGLSIVISIGSGIILFFLKNRTYSLLKTLSDLTLSVFPNLLGFTLGGFAIVVGFSNSKVIEESTTTEDHSIYQMLNAIFSLTILVQVFITIISFLINGIIKMLDSNSLSINIGFPGELINIIIIVIVLFGAIYSLFLLPYVVINLFTLGQVNNSFFTIEKLKSEIKNKSNDPK